VLALQALRELQARAIRVPDDMSVIGFDDVPDAAAAGLTTMAQPLVEKGRAAARLLLAGIQRGQPMVAVTVIPGSRLPHRPR